MAGLGQGNSQFQPPKGGAMLCPVECLPRPMKYVTYFSGMECPTIFIQGVPYSTGELIFIRNPERDVLIDVFVQDWVDEKLE